MSTIKIPAAALEAGSLAVLNARMMSRSTEEIARACFLAMLNAWEGMNRDNQAWRGCGTEVIILPLPPQENSDE